MPLTALVPVAVPRLPDPAILAGQLAPASILGYQHDLAAYLRFCADPQTAQEAASLARWRTHLAHDTQLSPPPLIGGWPR